MKHKYAALPHFFTISNIFLGFLSITYSLHENYTTAAWCIAAASVFDNLDGKIARMTHTHSRFGMELDSLADIISFGVAPAFLVYTTNFSAVGIWGVFFSFLFVLAGVFRLARFNITQKSFKKNKFRGLPIPMAALAVVTFMIFSKEIWGVVTIVPAYLVLVPALSLLMVSNIEYETIPRLVVTRSIRKNANALVYITGFICVILYPREAFFPGTILYILKGLLFHIKTALKPDEEPAELPFDEDNIVK
ncbi:CDP-diacylglycerol--serine O-phosphatidyltransferase [candidate division KSB1 bacterium]